jgi:hypothetical protein
VTITPPLRQYPRTLTYIAVVVTVTLVLVVLQLLGRI